MNILIVGGGGREHALAWSCAKSNAVKQVFVAPGNGGTATENKLTNVNINIEDLTGLAKFAQDKNIALTIVGPEVPLVMGIVDLFRQQGLTIFGPTQKASQLEGSKIFCKDFLSRNNIPSAFYKTFNETAPAIQYIEDKGVPIVIKADGLAAGKGVVVAQTKQEAIAAVNDMLIKNSFGNAGASIVIEEFLSGEEASFIVMTDGENILPMATSQDHKARDNGDKGPNTGGMGAYSPAPVVNNEVFNYAMKQIITPTIKAMAKEGNHYTGFLYAGLMIDKNNKAKVLEFNCRFGDPETQPIMLRLKSDLTELCLLATKGQLNQANITWDERTALGVVLAAKGYPGKYTTGDIINLPKDNNNAKIFHAGTTITNNNICANGGRVLCATAMGRDTKEAQNNAYKLLKKIKWQGSYYRDDIGFKAL